MGSGFTSPYVFDEPPTSPRRALLATAFTHWCALHTGHSPPEIAAALTSEPKLNVSDVREITMAARLIGELIAAGRIRSFARPFGGGSPLRLQDSDWEIDDFRSRFERSALDPTRPFDRDAEPTHWIFVDLDDFNTVIEASCAEVLQPRKSRNVEERLAGGEAASEPGTLMQDRLVRLPEVMQITGMSRSTIYRRIEQGRFPDRHLDGNVSSWLESDLRKWMAARN